MAYNVNYRRWDTLATEKVVRAYPADILGLIEPEAGQAADLRARVKDIFPHYYRATGGNLSLFSRYPITAARTDNLQTRYHNLFATLNVQGKAAQVVVTHPLAPISRNYFNLRNQTIRSLANYAQKQKTPLIIMGDFNATSWSPYMRAFGQRSGLRNASQGHGIHLTWFYSNFRSPYQLIKIPIDHIFVSPNIPVSEITAGEPGVSDHRPVIAKIRF
jgi:endonuclease/exonuclease/phosphatase (EEP) superfamily protein YafD